jgi:para-aminobenzoate synthetase/4-amino-4-deoxychorismate lyase
VSLQFSIPPKFFPCNLEAYVADEQNVVLLETSKCDYEHYRSFLFTKPAEILQVFSPDEIPHLFDSIEEKLQEGYHAAGYMAYECGFHFENIPQEVAAGSPLAWFGVYRAPMVFNHATGMWEGTSPGLQSGANFNDKECRVSDVQFRPSRETYVDRIHAIRNHIREGDVYQINFTGRMSFQFEGSALGLYRSLKQKQRVPYSTFIRTGHETFISLSPELFFHRSGNRMVTRPMKGTAPRGRTVTEDSANSMWLRNDAKNRAENIMIVDVLRNDLGKISNIGSVKTSNLHNVEKYDSLFQMTSTVGSELRENVRYYDIFNALFPSGSITGAPKRRAMQIIDALEETPRGIYTGAIGYISPSNEAMFNVAIRTAALRDSKGEIGIGGGITWDSNAEDEYLECELKSKFFLQPPEEFTLIETLFWDGTYRLPDKHLERLTSSAAYFDFPCDTGLIRQRLESITTEFDTGKQYRVRLTLDRFGSAEITWNEFSNELRSAPTVFISPVRTSSMDRFLYHKTSKRALYETSYMAAKEAGFFDVIFMNERDQITEGSRTNIFILKDNIYHTPPVTCGLLNGIYRQHMLRTLGNAVETILTVQDIHDADAVFVCNSLRGWNKVNIVFDIIKKPSPSPEHVPG